MAIGGNEAKTKDAAILRAFIERAGGADARIAIIPSASAEPVARAAQYAGLFREMGASRVYPVHAERGHVTRDEQMLITNATGIFVTGGDQERLMDHLRRAGCADAIVDAVHAGAIYAGTSAGAAVVSRRMIAGMIETRGGEFVEYGEGLGLVSDVIVDQHFTQRQRLPRLIEAVTAHGLPGVGIDEDTAMIWEATGAIRVTGSGVVTFVDPAAAADDVRITVVAA
jgi:cyanophycinase